MGSNICRRTCQNKYLPVAALSTAINGGYDGNAESWMMAMVMAVGIGVAVDEPENYPSGW